MMYLIYCVWRGIMIDMQCRSDLTDVILWIRQYRMNLGLRGIIWVEIWEVPK